jgi:drug/metabolite transporter (DMT)-like permease
LLFTYPVFVLILGALFFGVKLSRYGIVSIFIAYLGLAVIFAGGDIASGKNVALGSALVLGCAVLFAGFQIFAKPVIDRIGSRLFTCIAMISAGGAVLLHFMLSRAVVGEGMMSALSLPPRVIMLGAVLGICCTVIPSFLMNIAIGRVGAQAVATLGMISPVLTIVAAVYVLGEPFGLIDGLGTLLTIFGIGLFTFFDKKRAKAPA